MPLYALNNTQNSFCVFQRNSLLQGTFLRTSFLYGLGSLFYRRDLILRLNVVYVYREKGDSSKARDYLPADKQYLVTRGVPCLRRATSLAYTDADEDAERLLNFGDSSAGGDGDEWVETHAGRKPNLDSAANPGEIADIPDDNAQDDDLASGVGNMSLGNVPAMSEIPDIDEIPDMEEEDLEEGDAATAPVKATPNVIDPRCVIALYSLSYFPS